MPGASHLTIAASQKEGTKPPWGFAWRLAWGQLLSWGVLYYAFTTLSAPIHSETGWSRSLINGGLSLGLLTWGVLALPVGMWIQRRGAGNIMTAGSLIGGVAFATLGLVNEPWHFYLAWIGVGGAMATLLYDPAFAAVTVAFGSRYKQGIVLITLLAGFAGTVFIPLSHLLVDNFGWRQTCIGLGIVVAGIGAAIHRRGEPGNLPANGEARQPHCRSGIGFNAFKHDFSDRRFSLLALWFTTYSAAFSGLIFLIVPAMTSLGATPGALLAAIALIGPMQVVGRLLIVARGPGFSAIEAGRWAMISMTLSLLILLFLPFTFAWLACFAVFFGMGNGVMTIVKGTAIAEFFGRERYPELNGAIAAPSMISKAVSPFLLSAIWDQSAEPILVFITLLGLLLAGLAAVYCLASEAARMDQVHE
ncbi:MAG: MFS transporter [Verrucomicrobiales bacterium]|nr:MFS transporter [Verrucomicrobiales bacterium]